MGKSIEFLIGLVWFVISIVGCFGYAFYFIVWMLKRSNDYGSENKITDFSSKGFEDFYFEFYSRIRFFYFNKRCQ